MPCPWAPEFPGSDEWISRRPELGLWPGKSTGRCHEPEGSIILVWSAWAVGYSAAPIVSIRPGVSKVHARKQSCSRKWQTWQRWRRRCQRSQQAQSSPHGPTSRTPSEWHYSHSEECSTDWWRCWRSSPKRTRTQIRKSICRNEVITACWRAFANSQEPRERFSDVSANEFSGYLLPRCQPAVAAAQISPRGVATYQALPAEGDRGTQSEDICQLAELPKRKRNFGFAVCATLAQTLCGLCKAAFHHHLDRRNRYARHRAQSVRGQPSRDSPSRDCRESSGSWKSRHRPRGGYHGRRAGSQARFRS
mmetsp:Transcript_7177/g.12851  ORF Transcript_7177/g.12851 Transcript_7177/m.12851 type:complete len:306 (-) Transcript_7177:21-938(-)